MPNKLSADNGYMSGDNLQALKNSSIEPYIATNKGEKKNKISLDEQSVNWSKLTLTMMKQVIPLPAQANKHLLS